ncbi:MAG TPA: cytochrome c maturation protein CcmE [Gaiellaceae bacterium]|nr:cytochrome c maturation protein CcmE [Gaiellaceae bacterium]
MSRGNPARLVIALSVAATLALFLLYTSLAGGATRSLQPGQLGTASGTVNLAGLVLGPVRGDADAAGLRFRLRDIDGTKSVAVLYRGSVPDLFKTGRHVFVRGTLRRGVFVASPNSLMTKCPSRYVTKGT